MFIHLDRVRLCVDSIDSIFSSFFAQSLSSQTLLCFSPSSFLYTFRCFLLSPFALISHNFLPNDVPNSVCSGEDLVFFCSLKNLMQFLLCAVAAHNHTDTIIIHINSRKTCAFLDGIFLFLCRYEQFITHSFAIPKRLCRLSPFLVCF